MADRRTTERKGNADKTGKPRKTAARKATAPPAAKPARRAAARPGTPPTDSGSGSGTEAPGAGGLWRAGLKALDNVRQDVTRRHTNVIESLLGIAPARTDAAGKPIGRAFPGLESLGLRKFEDVFDQRVAAALERLGIPTREELQALRQQLDQVLTQLERLEAPAPAPAHSPARRKR